MRKTERSITSVCYSFIALLAFCCLFSLAPSFSFATVPVENRGGGPHAGYIETQETQGTETPDAEETLKDAAPAQAEGREGDIRIIREEKGVPGSVRVPGGNVLIIHDKKE